MEEALPRGDLLTIILDCNPFWWGKSVSTTDSGLLPSSSSSSSVVVGGNETSNVLSHCLNSVLALANAHLLFDANNQVAIIASYNNQTKFLRLVSICRRKSKSLPNWHSSHCRAPFTVISVYLTFSRKKDLISLSSNFLFHSYSF